MIGLLTGCLIFASALETREMIGSGWILYFGHDRTINSDEIIAWLWDFMCSMRCLLVL